MSLVYLKDTLKNLPNETCHYVDYNSILMVSVHYISFYFFMWMSTGDIELKKKSKCTEWHHVYFTLLIMSNAWLNFLVWTTSVIITWGTKCVSIKKDLEFCALIASRSIIATWNLCSISADLMLHVFIDKLQCILISCQKSFVVHLVSNRDHNSRRTTCISS